MSETTNTDTEPDTTTVSIATGNWILRSDPPARINSGSYLLSSRRPDWYVTFDTVAGVGTPSRSLTLYQGETPIITINADDLTEDIANGIRECVPRYNP